MCEFLCCFSPESCTALPTPSNGRLSTSDTTAGTVVHIDCDNGYTFDPATGSKSVVCRSDGSWNSTLAGCKEGVCACVCWLHTDSRDLHMHTVL